MKKLIETGIAAALLFTALTSCGTKNNPSEISPKELPASGAKLPVTSMAGAASAFKAIVENITEDQAVYTIANKYEENKDLFAEKFEDMLENSSYIQELTSSFDEAQENITSEIENFKRYGFFHFSYDKKPGKATDLPEGVEINIPLLSASASVSVNDLNNPSSGSGTITTDINGTLKFDDLIVKVPDFHFLLTGKLNCNIMQMALNLDASMDFNPNFELSYPGIDLKMKVEKGSAKINGNTNGAKGKFNVNYEVLGNASFDYDAEKLGAPEAMIKKFVAKGKSAVTADVSLDILSILPPDGNEHISMNMSQSGGSGLVFKAPNGTGGKLICNYRSSYKGKLDFEGVMDSKKLILEFTEKLLDMLDDEKLSKAEFDAYKIPLEIDMNISFYDDENNKTFEAADIHSAYEYYVFLYDLLDAANLRESAAKFLYLYATLLDNYGSSYGNDSSDDSFDYDYDYDDEDYDDWWESDE